jgi:hypothetical protein
MPSTAPADSVQGTVIDAVVAARATAEHRLIAATGGGPLCSVEHGRIDETKYAEGRWAALTEAQRAVSGSPDPVAAVVAVQQKWTAQARRDPAASAAWTAYWAGGVDAVTDVLGGQR